MSVLLVALLAVFQNCGKGAGSPQDSSTGGSNSNSSGGMIGDTNLPVIPSGISVPPPPPIQPNLGIGETLANIRVLMNAGYPKIIQTIDVTITGVGISTPVIYSWTSTDPNTSPPNSLSLIIPQGAARLVAMQATTFDPTTNTTTSYFGNATFDAISSDESLSVPLYQQP